jgi:radical SAM superfamily enzyme YgiQ (UPF0313 family)
MPDAAIGADVLVGFPGEDEQTIQETCNLIKALQPDQVAVQLGVRVYPGTPLAKQTRGLLWQEESDLYRPVFASLPRDFVLDRFTEGLADLYEHVWTKGNMIVYH